MTRDICTNWCKIGHFRGFLVLMNFLFDFVKRRYDEVRRFRCQLPQIVVTIQPLILLQLEF